MSDINPAVDLAFKKIFGVEENKDLLIALINSIVSQEDQVASVTILNPYNPQNFRNDKLSILDIKAEGETGKKFNIEIQISDEADYDKRALYYWAKLYTEQLQSGRDYSLLNKAIGIHILNFTSIPEVKKYHNVFNIREKESNIEYFKDLELHTIELKKFMDEAGNELSTVMARVKSKVDLWSAFLTKYDLMNPANLTGSFDDPDLKKALGVLEVMSLNPAEREEYESHLKWLRIETNTLKKHAAEAREEGIAEGMEKGIKQGIKQGIEQGEENKAISIAKLMLSKNKPISEIVEFTNLSEEEVKLL